MTMPKLPIAGADLAALAQGVNGRKWATFAAGMLAGVWLAEAYPERWAAVLVVLRDIAGWLAVTLAGGSAVASVKRSQAQAASNSHGPRVEREP